MSVSYGSPKQVLRAMSMFNIVRQHGPTALKAPMLPCLMSPKHEIRKQILVVHDAFEYPNHSHLDVLEHRAATGTCIEPIPCATDNAAPSKYSDPEIWINARPTITHSFLWSRACILLLSQRQGFKINKKLLDK